MNVHNTYQEGGQIGQGEGKNVDHYYRSPQDCMLLVWARNVNFKTQYLPSNLIYIYGKFVYMNGNTPGI